MAAGPWVFATGHMAQAYPGGLDPTLPLMEIVWWVNKELVFHAGEAWIVRDLYAHRR